MKRIETISELDEFLTLHAQDQPTVSVQQAISSDFIETEHIFIIYPNQVEYVYSSIQLTANSAWYGNLFEESPKLSLAQQIALSRATRALQEEGYSDQRGLLVGFDSLAKDDEMYIIEINARWLGSLPVARLLKRLDLLNRERVFSSFDYILEEEFKKYMEFSEEYLYSPSNNRDFSVIPLSFSAYSTGKKRIVYFLVTGNMGAFHRKVRNIFTDDSFEMLEHSMGQLIEKNLLCQT